WLIVAGSLALVIGIVSIAVPVIASLTAAIFMGWVLVAAGIAVAIPAVSHRAPVRGLEALIALAAGFYLLVFPRHGAVTLTFVLAVWFFARGILTLTYAMQWRGVPGSWIYGLGGILSVILGFMIAASLPSSGTWAIGLLVGVDLIFWGVRALVSARLLKELEGSL
ncbi:MAG: HdeD family acid-resistance protein, partial [Solirubrobacteraceae bacterium]